jgi:hypothetical protein
MQEHPPLIFALPTGVVLDDRLIISVSQGEIEVILPGTDFRAVYYKFTGEPQLFAKSPPNGSHEFRARAWWEACQMARQLARNPHTRRSTPSPASPTGSAARRVQKRGSRTAHLIPLSRRQFFDGDAESPNVAFRIPGTIGAVTVELHFRFNKNFCLGSACALAGVLKSNSHRVFVAPRVAAHGH